MELNYQIPAISHVANSSMTLTQVLDKHDWAGAEHDDHSFTIFLSLFFFFFLHSQIIHGAMKVAYFLTRDKRSLAASLIVFSTQHVTFRLVWVLAHYKQVCGRPGWWSQQEV